jgi:predicted DNA-binding protein
MFTMRLSDEEGTRLDSIAEHYGLNGVGVIRMLLKREADKLSDLANAHNERAQLLGVRDAMSSALAKEDAKATAKKSKKK